MKGSPRLDSKLWNGSICENFDCRKYAISQITQLIFQLIAIAKIMKYRNFHLKRLGVLLNISPFTTHPVLERIKLRILRKL